MRLPGRPRLDQWLVENSHFATRAAAQAAIAAGLVRVDGEPARKASQPVPAGANVEAEAPHPFVSRAGLKLEAALSAAGIDPAGRVALDLGASTGGFSDCLLQRGAARVYAVDVGRDQLHPRLRTDSRLVAFEGLDARDLSETDVPDPVDLLVADLSFIGIVKAIPAGLARLKPGGWAVLLIKPQFEAGPGAGKRGVIRDEALRNATRDRVAAELDALGLDRSHLLPSPITGGDGNVEFLYLGRKRP